MTQCTDVLWFLAVSNTQCDTTIEHGSNQFAHTPKIHTMNLWTRKKWGTRMRYFYLLAIVSEMLSATNIEFYLFRHEFATVKYRTNKTESSRHNMAKALAKSLDEKKLSHLISDERKWQKLHGNAYCLRVKIRTTHTHAQTRSKIKKKINGFFPRSISQT